MRLHEGKPGERLKCKDSIWHYVTIPRRPTSAATIRVEREDGTFQRDMRFNDLVRDDWEVADRIEKGDTVKRINTDMEYIVVWAKDSSRIMVQYKTDMPEALPRNEFVLICKGTKEIDCGVLNVVSMNNERQQVLGIPPKLSDLPSGDYQIWVHQIRVQKINGD